MGMCGTRREWMNKNFLTWLLIGWPHAGYCFGNPGPCCLLISVAGRGVTTNTKATLLYILKIKTEEIETSWKFCLFVHTTSIEDFFSCKECLLMKTWDCFGHFNWNWIGNTEDRAMLIHPLRGRWDCFRVSITTLNLIKLIYQSAKKNSIKNQRSDGYYRPEVHKAHRWIALATG